MSFVYCTLHPVLLAHQLLQKEYLQQKCVYVSLDCVYNTSKCCAVHTYLQCKVKKVEAKYVDIIAYVATLYSFLIGDILNNILLG
jgi:hypothetical protein